MKRRAAGPSISASKKRRRSPVSRSRSAVDLRSPRSHSAKSPSRVGMSASSRSRSRRASTGEAPPVEMATRTGSRSTRAGTMKRDASPSSTTFTGMPRASARLAIQRLTARRDVATIASRASSKSPGTNSRSTTVRVPAAARSRSSGAIRGATTVMTAPLRSNSNILRNATSPPPTTNTCCPLRSKKTGKYFTASSSHGGVRRNRVLN